MSYRGWYTKKDVLKDLQRATGSYMHDLDEGSVLFGEQPPPQRYIIPDQDAELQLERLCGGSKPSTPDVTVKPDLAGITQMLRMVDSLVDEDQHKDEPVIKMESSDVLKISKLNPYVEEFIPKSSNVSKTIISPVKETNKTVETEAKSDSFNLSEGRIDTEQLTQDEKKVMKEMLKSKISDTSNATCVKVKRERNLAIATLLKLHCAPQKAPGGEKLKLISPAYFEKPNGSYPEKITTQEVDIGDVTNVKNSTEDSVGKYPKVEPSTEKTQTSDIAASVDKVQKWLNDSKIAEPINGGEKPFSPPIIVKQTNGRKESTDKLFLDVVTFKRKAPSKSASPTSTDSNVCVKSPKYDKVFKPSKYAEELTKKYMERSIANENASPTIWMGLESKLKDRDEEIKRKREEKLNAEWERFECEFNDKDEEINKKLEVKLNAERESFECEFNDKDEEINKKLEVKLNAEWERFECEFNDKDEETKTKREEKLNEERESSECKFNEKDEEIKKKKERTIEEFNDEDVEMKKINGELNAEHESSEGRSEN